MISGPVQQTWHSDGNRNSEKSVEHLKFSETPQSYAIPWWLKSYAIYYIVSLLYNAFLISLYIVMSCAAHSPCLTRGGSNITDRFEFVF